MDTPICVCDAQTFVDHIHQIKAWLYAGQLRLVVPMSTCENVEQLYKRSAEPSPTVQEQSRPKSAGKLARKVHPAFDINPTIAKEFLCRIQKGKEGEQYAKDRPIYEEDERWDAMQFQASTEEYAPWKDIPVEKQEVEAPDDRPLSWAELAKKRLMANGNADKSLTPTGPIKPKLVSKASGSDMQPWKIQKNAPTISAKDVPGHLRSLMSCALWRLHESIDRNDFNQLFFLTDQEQTRIVAKNLNMVVRSTKELGKRIAATTKRDDLNIIGMLEKENLVKPKEEAKIIAPAEKPGKETTEEQALRPDTDLPHVDNIGHDGNADHISNTERPQDSMRQIDEKDQHSEVDIDRSNSVKSISKPVLNQSQQTSETKEVQDGNHSTKNLLPAAETTNASLSQTEKSVSTPDKQAVELKTDAAKPVLCAAQESPEDSDEEIVVFVPNPKRMSAQRKGLVSASRPTTAHGESPASPLQSSPRVSLHNAQDVAKAVEHNSPQARRISHGRPRPLSSGHVVNDSSRGPVPQGHPESLNPGPTLIDPDAFGRGFAVNTGAGTLANVGPPKKARQHSPRTSMQYANPNSSGTQVQNSPRTSPSRQKPGRSPRPSPRVAPQTVEDSPPAAIPVISHQAYTRAPLVAPNPQTTQRSRFGAIGPPSKSTSVLRPSEPSAEIESMRDSTPRHYSIQRPRSANGPGSGNGFNPAPFQSQRLEASTASIISGRGGNREQRPSRPSLFEPELDRTAAPKDADFEPRRTNMPEVQYTLKSGTTREAARGKGKLWTG